MNGGLFGGPDDGSKVEVPVFNKMARTYLLRAGDLDWTAINPDIFGSMIQAVADDDERGELGMHYTSVPNILKVLNPLFLDSLKTDLEKAGKNKQQLGKLKKRIARIRVFDPACGSGNFLVIAYKKMREIEHKANQAAGWETEKSVIPLTNFRGIELKSFAAEIARLALIIAEYQCDELYMGQREALALFLPLEKTNWITCGNALRLDWLSICPPTGETTVKLQGDDLFNTPLEQSEIDFENEGGETYICGNPPFSGTRKQSAQQKADLEAVFAGVVKNYKSIDYVGGWFMKASQFNEVEPARFAFVSTNSICQGQQIPLTWAAILNMGLKIRFAHKSFKWGNLAKHNAGVTVIVAGVDQFKGGKRFLFDGDAKTEVSCISPYLVPQDIDIIPTSRTPIFHNFTMLLGVYYSKSAGLILTKTEVEKLEKAGFPNKLLKRFLGSNEVINGQLRYCLWIDHSELDTALKFKQVKNRIESVRQDRLATKDKSVNKLALKPYQFREYRGNERRKLIIPIVSSEARAYLPVALAGDETVPTNKAFYIGDPPLWLLSLLASKLHLCWVKTVCGRLELRISYSSSLGWNTFPVPKLTTKNKADLTAAAENILLAREAHFPATIADLYKPKSDKHPGMPENLRIAHNENDRILEEIYIGRRFKNDTERLEKLFEMYWVLCGANRVICWRRLI